MKPLRLNVVAMATQYLTVRDDLSQAINAAAADLAKALHQLPVDTLPLESTFADYFKQHHLGNRLHYSLQNSAHILYDTVQLSGKSRDQLTLVDYGAGLGTLYLLAGRLGFKSVWYNDYLPAWAAAAKIIAEGVGSSISGYVTGGIGDFLDAVEAQDARIDIVASRNVIEHIYSLEEFYQRIYQHHPKAIVFSTTTANAHNPVMRWKHRRLHQFTERTYYLERRANMIRNWWPSVSDDVVQRLVPLTRGLDMIDFQQSVNVVREQGVYPTPSPHLYSNTCDPETGYWCERLLPEVVHRQLAEAAGFQFACTAGYWDTHYRNPLLNVLGVSLNALRPLLGNKQKSVVPFINLIAWNPHD